MAAELLLAARAPRWPGASTSTRPSTCSPPQAQPDRTRKLDYRSYMRSFEADAPGFYRREGDYTLGERLAAAWAAFREPRR